MNPNRSESPYSNAYATQHNGTDSSDRSYGEESAPRIEDNNYTTQPREENPQTHNATYGNQQPQDGGYNNQQPQGTGFNNQQPQGTGFNNQQPQSGYNNQTPYPQPQYPQHNQQPKKKFPAWAKIFILLAILFILIPLVIFGCVAVVADNAIEDSKGGKTEVSNSDNTDKDDNGTPILNLGETATVKDVDITVDRELGLRNPRLLGRG